MACFSNWFIRTHSSSFLVDILLCTRSWNWLGVFSPSRLSKNGRFQILSPKISIFGVLETLSAGTRVISLAPGNRGRAASMDYLSLFICLLEILDSWSLPGPVLKCKVLKDTHPQWIHVGNCVMQVYLIFTTFDFGRFDSHDLVSRRAAQF